jgi:uncharacterized protein (TIGR02147 family)
MKKASSQHIQSFIYHQFLQLKSRRPQYSMRAFARDLQIPAATLSLILSGKRGLSPEVALKILNKLQVSEEEIKELLYLQSLNHDGNDQQDDHRSERLVDSILHSKIIAEWEHFSVLTLLYLPGDCDIESQNALAISAYSLMHLAKRLDLTVSRAKTVATNLDKAGFIEFDREKNIVYGLNQKFKTTQDIPSEAIVAAYINHCEILKEKIHRLNIVEREVTIETLCMSPEDMTEAKKLIRQFRDKFAAKVQKHTPTEIYRLSIQLVPMSVITPYSPENSNQEVLQ